MTIKFITLALTLLLLVGISTQDDGVEKHWALLVAGSNGYYNYRHQADICHAYHIVRNHGIPPEQIVVMMFDDIAESPDNPIKGNVINRPNGPNVYPGVGKDYTKGEVTPEVFLKVLTGDSEGVKRLLGRDGKVIKSGPNDRVFVNFADHGAPGLIAFPSSVLKATALNDALLKMYNHKQYKELVLYVEACESGSMFNKLLRKDINIFATTAANPDESSYACYFDKKRQTYLGDVYSVNWMEDSDREDLRSETLQKQFELVKKETNTSHVQEYGDLTLSKLPIADFQGNETSRSKMSRRLLKKVNPNRGAVPSEDVALTILERKNDIAGLDKLIRRRDSTRAFFQEVVSSVSDFDYLTLQKMPVELNDYPCYYESVDSIQEVCPGMNLPQNDYALRSLRVFANLCDRVSDKEMILSTIRRIAQHATLCE